MQPQTRRLIPLPIAACLFLFFLLALLIHQSGGAPLAADDALRYPIYSLRTPWLTDFLTAVTRCGNWTTITPICVLLLISSALWKPFGSGLRANYGVCMSAGALLSLSLYKIIKTIFLRPRPDVALHLIVQGGYSFPSGHAMTSLVFYGLFLLWIRRFLAQKNTSRKLRGIVTALFSCFIFLIGFSRIYLGVHYPSDVLAGWCVGFCLFHLFSRLFPGK